MKPITIIQAAALVFLAVAGAYANSTEKGGCSPIEQTAQCE